MGPKSLTSLTSTQHTSMGRLTTMIRTRYKHAKTCQGARIGKTTLIKSVTPMVSPWLILMSCDAFLKSSLSSIMLRGRLSRIQSRSYSKNVEANIRSQKSSSP